MRFLLLLFISLLPYYLSAQVTLPDGEKYIEFTLKHPIAIDDINWSKEKLYSEFVLSGKTPLKYSFTISNDTVAKLSLYKNGKWEFQENVEITSWSLRNIDGTKITSDFKITDFDKDGDEDLLIWAFSNMNGNIWTLIFLNDQKQQRLAKLWDTAEESDIWPMPEFNAATNILSVQQHGSAFGYSYEAQYKLNGLDVRQ